MDTKKIGVVIAATLAAFVVNRMLGVDMILARMAA